MHRLCLKLLNMDKWSDINSIRLLYRNSKSLISLIQELEITFKKTFFFLTNDLS